MTDLIQPELAELAELAELGLTISHLPPPPPSRLARSPTSSQRWLGRSLSSLSRIDLICKTAKLSSAYHFRAVGGGGGGSCEFIKWITTVHYFQEESQEGNWGKYQLSGENMRTTWLAHHTDWSNKTTGWRAPDRRHRGLVWPLLASQRIFSPPVGLTPSWSNNKQWVSSHHLASCPVQQSHTSRWEN